MLVRLAFAVQVQVEPDILIVDEALAVGDALFQKRCFQKIACLVANGTTLLFVSHDQENVRTLTSRCLLLDRGSAAAWGRSSDVLLEYRRRLNEEEAAYFAAAVRDVAERAHQVPEAPLPADPPPAAPQRDAAAPAVIDAAREEGASSVKRAFGDESITVVAVETLDGQGKPCAVYLPGDTLAVRITCRANVASEKLNIGVRIRNKEGVKIYSWGTLNQDMSRMSAGANEPIFWSRRIQAGETFSVTFQCPCNLGMNLYEVQASASYEDTPDYMSQRILHWVDEAAFFQVLTRRHEHFFGGVADLRMQAAW
jgi:lipopolysaccharide transport system ATP-binding protein